MTYQNYNSGRSMESNYRQKYLENLSRGVEGMWLKQRYTDVNVKAADRTYGAHRLLLGSVSNFFRDMFMHDRNNTVHVPNIDSPTFEVVLTYIYTGKIQSVRDNLEAVLSASVELQVEGLREICEDLLAEKLTSETCVGIYKLAIRLGCTALSKHSWAYILEFFEAVVKTREYLNLSVDELVTIINDNDLNTASEEIVCDAVLTWVNANADERLQYLDKLFMNIRFPLITAGYIERLRNHPVVVSSKSSQDILDQFSKDTNASPTTKMVNPLQFHYRTEEMICIVGTRSRQPNPEMTEIKCFSYHRGTEYKLAAIPTEPGACFAVCSNNNDVYLSGGYMGQKSFLRFVSSENKWQPCADMQEGRWGHTMVAASGNVYSIGGSKKIPELISSIEMYNPQTNTSSLVGNMVIPVSFATVASIGTKLYIFGGKMEDGNFCRKVQRFDTTSMTSAVVCDMPRITSTTGRAVEINNCIFVFFNQGEVVMFKEDMTPEVVASGATYDHFGVVSHNGRILIDGCFGNQYTSMLFDPATRSFKQFRSVKAALCNFYCMPVVMSRNVLHSCIN